MQLLAGGAEPTINDIAAAADVSRRTVYLHFPTLDQLLLDATLGLMNADVDAVLAEVTSTDPHERVCLLVESVYASMVTSAPLGRRLIKLTVDATAGGPADPTGPRRGYRRVGWLEWAVDPVRDRLGDQAWQDLISALAVVIGWESFIVLTDVRGLDPGAARELTGRLALTVLDGALNPPGPPPGSAGAA